MQNDNSTTLHELKSVVKKFSEERDWDQYHNAKDLAIGIVTEASELLEKLRFKSESEVELLLKSPASRKAIGEELSDTLYFVLRLAQKYDFDLSTELREKIRKNGLRYPIERSKGSNKKYDELAP